MKKIKKIIIYYLCFLFIAFSFSGCTVYWTNRPSITSGTRNNTKITLLTVSMHGGTDPNAPVYKQITQEFMKVHDNIQIYDESQASDQEWKTKIAADFAVGNEPDVIQFFTDQNASHILAADKFVTIEEILEVYPDYAADILPDVLAAAANPDGIQRAVPTVGFWEGLYCNKDLFDKYQVPLPYDWDSLVNAIKIFKANKIIPISVSLYEIPHYWIEFLLLYHSDPGAYNNIPESTPNEWVKGIEMLKTLNDLGAFPKDTDTLSNAAAENIFKDKEAAMMLNGSWFLAGIPDQENTIVIPFPSVSEDNQVTGAIIGGVSTGFYITKKAWNDPDKRDAAVKYVMAHTSRDSIRMYWNGIGQAASDVDPIEDLTPLAISAQQYSKSAANIYSPIDSRISQDVFSTFVREIIDVVFYDKSAKELIDEMLYNYSK